MNPGNNVASPKSITSAPAGSSTFAPTAVILPSVTTTIPGFTTASLFPSNSRAAFSTYVFFAAACPQAIVAQSAANMPAVIARPSHMAGTLLPALFIRYPSSVVEPVGTQTIFPRPQNFKPFLPAEPAYNPMGHEPTLPAHIRRRISYLRLGYLLGATNHARDARRLRCEGADAAFPKYDRNQNTGEPLGGEPAGGRADHLSQFWTPVLRHLALRASLGPAFNQTHPPEGTVDRAPLAT